MKSGHRNGLTILLTLWMSASMMSGCTNTDSHGQKTLLLTQPSTIEGQQCASQCESVSHMCLSDAKSYEDKCTTRNQNMVLQCEEIANANRIDCMKLMVESKNSIQVCASGYSMDMKRCQKKKQDCGKRTSECNSMFEQCYVQCGGKIQYE
jgi:hypothetical protein